MRLISALSFVLALISGPAAPDELLTKGKATYKQFCSHCHGVDMVNPGTSSFDLRKFPKDQQERFYTSVRKGKNDMPAMGDLLYPEEIDALWRYVVTRGGKEPLASAAPDASRAARAKTGAAPDLIRPGRLIACLALNGGAMSARRADGGIGFDYDVTAALAERLDLALDVLWYEAELEEDTDPVRDAYALLAKPLCDVVPGHALYASAVGAPPADRAALPRWKKTPRDTVYAPEFVALRPVAHSVPYARMEIGVVLRAPREIRRLEDLSGLHVGIEQGTLAGALTVTQAPADVRRAATTFPPGPEFLWLMETGRFDAALVSTATYDFHRRQNPITGLILSDYRHPLGFNTGFALLADKAVLRSRIDTALNEMLADGTITRLAARNDTHIAAPRAPFVHPPLRLRDLYASR